MYECFVCMYVCVLCACLVPAVLRASDPLEFWMEMNYHVGGGNQTWVLFKSN